MRPTIRHSSTPSPNSRTASGLKRGEIWTASGGPGYAGKPRPVIVVQADDFDETDSITICPLTTHSIGTRHARAAIEPTPNNGLREACFAMADKITTMPRSRLGKRLGELKPTAMAAINRAMLVFLGLAGTARD
jgi:mRNA interferase MazF